MKPPKKIEWSELARDMNTGDLIKDTLDFANLEALRAIAEQLHGLRADLRLCIYQNHRDRLCSDHDCKREHATHGLDIGGEVTTFSGD